MRDESRRAGVVPALLIALAEPHGSRSTVFSGAVEQSHVFALQFGKFCLLLRCENLVEGSIGLRPDRGQLRGRLSNGACGLVDASGIVALDGSSQAFVSSSVTLSYALFCSRRIRIEGCCLLLLGRGQTEQCCHPLNLVCSNIRWAGWRMLSLSERGDDSRESKDCDEL
jgi:hypothetical protein